MSVKKKFCTTYLKGAKPTQPVVTVTKTKVKTTKGTSTVHLTVTNTDIVRTTIGSGDVIVTVTAPPSTSTEIVAVTSMSTTTYYKAPSTPSPVNTETGDPQSLRRRAMIATSTAKIRAANPTSQACLLALYGQTARRTSTKTKTVTSTRAAITTTQRSTKIITMTSTIGLAGTTSTQTVYPSPVIVTATTTYYDVQSTTVAITEANGATCYAYGDTFSCTYTPPTKHSGLVSTFKAPCLGVMNVQLDGAKGGSNTKHATSQFGYSVQSQIKLEPGNDQVPEDTLFDVTIGGDGYSLPLDGKTDGGFNGGGKGSTSTTAGNDGGGGGGSTIIQYQQNPIVVAGGAGGNGIQGIGNTRQPAQYIGITSGGDGAPDAGVGGGGGGSFGGKEGDDGGYGGYNGANDADEVNGYAQGSGQAVISFTCMSS